MGTVIDVTERKRAEEKIREQEMEFQQMLDFAPQQVAVLGPDGNVFMPTALRSTISALVLKSGGKDPKFFDPVGSFTR